MRPIPSWVVAPANVPVFSVCHPDWRGVRAATLAFGTAMIETDDLETDAMSILQSAREANLETVIIQGWPSGAGAFARHAAASDIKVKVVVHSSMAQHTAEQGEAAAIDEVVGLAREGVINEVGFVKIGVSQVFSKAGIPSKYVPNRVPQVEVADRVELGPGFHVGVFAEPIWRKNLGTQLGAVSIMDGVAHVLSTPVGVPAIGPMREHGVTGPRQFLRLLAATQLNLNVTLSECYPMTPMESYVLGVPCLISRTSDVFRSDPDLWELTSIDELDNPESIAAAAKRLMDHRDEALARAENWLTAADTIAAESWAEFTAP